MLKETIVSLFYSAIGIKCKIEWFLKKFFDKRKKYSKYTFQLLIKPYQPNTYIQWSEKERENESRTTTNSTSSNSCSYRRLNRLHMESLIKSFLKRDVKKESMFLRGKWANIRDIYERKNKLKLNSFNNLKDSMEQVFFEMEYLINNGISQENCFCMNLYRCNEIGDCVDVHPVTIINFGKKFEEVRRTDKSLDFYVLDNGYITLKPMLASEFFKIYKYQIDVIFNTHQYYWATISFE